MIGSGANTLHKNTLIADEDLVDITGGNSGTRINGDLEVTGNIMCNGTSLTTIENYMLESEGII